MIWRMINILIGTVVFAALVSLLRNFAGLLPLRNMLLLVGMIPLTIALVGIVYRALTA